jgi:hypothetical protein
MAMMSGQGIQQGAEKTKQLVIFGEERFLGPISRKAGSALGMAGRQAKALFPRPVKAQAAGSTSHRTLP